MLIKYIKIIGIIFLALFISLCAAYYSVTGLSKLFSGSSFEVMVMTGTLEFAKVVIAAVLHTYWSILNRILKVYLTTATVVLMLITSIGIYGFLTDAYQKTSMEYELSNSKTELIELKKDQFESKIKRLEDEKNQLVSNISQLRKGLSNNVIEYIDSESGEKITTTSSANRNALEKQLESALDKENEIDLFLRNNYDSLNIYNEQIIVSSQNNTAAAELGPLIFISSVLNSDMDKVVNYLILMLIFVFDPLAISLIILASFLIGKIDSTNDDKETEIVEKVYTEIANDLHELENDDNINDISDDENNKMSNMGNENLSDSEVDDILDNMKEELSGKTIKGLSRKQIENMSHQYLNKHLRGQSDKKD